jgi:hypothetical protein
MMAPIKASSSENEVSIRYADLTHDADVVVGLEPLGDPPAHDLVVVQETHGNRQRILPGRSVAHRGRRRDGSAADGPSGGADAPGSDLRQRPGKLNRQARRASRCGSPRSWWPRTPRART